MFRGHGVKVNACAKLKAEWNMQEWCRGYDNTYAKSRLGNEWDNIMIDGNVNN